MADNLPLIPQKDSMCTDVRAVLREVFRDRDYLPPLVDDKNAHVNADDHTLPKPGQWIDKFTLESEELWKTEKKMKEQHARRIARQPLPNIYKLSKKIKSEVPPWTLKHGIITRKDLVPTIEQNAGRDNSLWVQNILNRSSCNVSCIEVIGSRVNLPLLLPAADDESVQSLSIGEAAVYRSPPPPPVPPPPQLPENIICIPSRLEFINFTVGQTYTQVIRVVNMSKWAVRLSLQPPASRDLSVCLPAAGLRLLAAGRTALRVRFTPRAPNTSTGTNTNKRHDHLVLRAAAQRDVVVPIHCYVEPPVLDLYVPNITWSSLSCCLSSPPAVGESDVLDLGARLLGDVHCAHLLLHCDAPHVSFFVLTEDDWLSCRLDSLSVAGAVQEGAWCVLPAGWRGGGGVSGRAWCRARSAGLHAARLRLVPSAGAARPLPLLADALLYARAHLSLQAQDKDYDICSEDDPACEYYVHLGTGFPNRSLSATVQLVNHSPVMYSYYWSVRPWGVRPGCREEQPTDGSHCSSDGSNDALEAQDENETESVETGNVAASLIRIEPAKGRIAPRSSCALHVCAPDAGAQLGVQRAVLMLILKDIPKESIPPEFEPTIIKTEVVQAEPIPGHEPWSREVCDVLCCQLEVWWEVVPVRFVLDPPVLFLPYSRKLKEIDLTLHAIQLYGREAVGVSWSETPDSVKDLSVPYLSPANPCPVTLKLMLPSLPNDYPVTEVLVLEAADGSWRARSALVCAGAVGQRGVGQDWLGQDGEGQDRVGHGGVGQEGVEQEEVEQERLGQDGVGHGGVGQDGVGRRGVGWTRPVPARAHRWPVAPRGRLTARLHLRNDTRDHISWWAKVWHWWGGTEASPQCVGRRRDSALCVDQGCTCALLQPDQGELQPGHAASLLYDVIVPERDGCVATLVQVQEAGRAALVAYRVLAPRLLLRARPCHARRVPGLCEGCALDAGDKSSCGTAVLRPSLALALGRCSCYRLQLTNITPLPTTVSWEEPIEKDGAIKVTFIPNDFDVGSYSRVEIRVVIEAHKVCGRKIFVYRATVARAYKPIYLLIDAAVAGVEVICEIPLGADLVKDEMIMIRNSQKEHFPWDLPLLTPLTAEQIFADEDRKRAIQTENICHCRYKMLYIPEVKPPRPPLPEGDASIEIVLEPPPLTRVCKCCGFTKPILRDYQQNLCLQFKGIPLKTVRSRTIVLRNVSVLTARWTISIRNWPRQRNRTLTSDAWSVDIKDPGVALQAVPSSGVLGSRASVEITVSVYADCWGLYRDQILIMIEKLEPMVLDVWIEVIGTPLQLVMKPQDSNKDDCPTLWMTPSDPDRIVRFKNTSRTEVIIRSYMLQENAFVQDVLPFRLYLRFFDVLPKTCPCVSAFDSEDSFEKESDHESVQEEMDTGIEIYMTKDYGVQTDTCYEMQPEITSILPGEYGEIKVTFNPLEHGEVAYDAILLMRLLPSQLAGPSWCRFEPEPQLVHLRQAVREGLLQASVCKLKVKYCALNLPLNEVLRIRKTFHIQNTGNGHMHLMAKTKDNWSIVQNNGTALTCGSGCGCSRRSGKRTGHVDVYLPPRCSKEMSVEVRIRTEEAWPVNTVTSDIGCETPSYPEWKKTVTPLFFYDQDNILLTIPLILELEYPILTVEPSNIDFGFVTDGDTRKTYFTVAHSSRSMTLDLVTEWLGTSDFKLWPTTLQLSPGCSGRVYIQYTARGGGGPAEGRAHCRAAVGGVGGAGAPWCWCHAAVSARAAPCRDRWCRLAAHDHTDDTHLLPDDLSVTTTDSLE